MSRTLGLSDPDPAWEQRYQDEARALAIAFPSACLEHIGSTAVPGLAAKPIIDIMLGLSATDNIEKAMAALDGIGYVLEDYYLDHYWLRRDTDGVRSINLHLFRTDSRQWHERILFRDALRSDPELAARYLTLKRELVHQHADELSVYTTAKWEFVEAVLAWHKY